MKQSAFIVIASLLLTTLSNCKKEDKANDNQPKDYMSLFKNTVWTGELHYTAQPIQPMSVEFKEGGQFVWSELGGDFPGTWKVQDRKLAISFATGSGFTADISDDNKLANITGFQGNQYVVDNAALNKDVDDILDNTAWQGATILIAFKPGNILDLKQLGLLSGLANLPYERKAKSIRFKGPMNNRYFLVSNGATLMKGAWYTISSPTIYSFELKKQ